MAKILIIDDDPSLLDVLSMAFEDAGYEVARAADGARGLELIEGEAVDAIVSDVNMPRIDGFALCRRLRDQGDQTPLILLTSRDNEIDEALGLDLGADDYVTKPFSTRVLLARIKALLRREALRRGAGDEPRSEPRALGRLELDLERLEIRWSGATLTTTVTEFRLVEALSSRPGVVLSRNTILERIRGDDTVVAHRIVDTYVRRLRRKFEAIDPGFEGIETVIGAGYRWSDNGG